MWPRAKGYQGPAEAERDRKGSSLETSEGIMTLLTLRSWTFSLQNFKKIHFYWFKASSLQSFVTTAFIHQTHNESFLATFMLMILRSIASAKTSLLSFTRSQPRDLGWLTDASSQDASPSYVSCLLFADSAAEARDLGPTSFCKSYLHKQLHPNYRCSGKMHALTSWALEPECSSPNPCSGIH